MATVARTKKVYRKTLHNKTWLRRAYMTKGQTTHDIGALLGCSPSTVVRALRRNGIPVRHEVKPLEERKCRECGNPFVVGGRGGRARSQVYCSRSCHMRQQSPRSSGSDAPRPRKNIGTLHNDAWLREHYVEKNWNMGHIAQVCNCSTSAVRWALDKFSIPIRPQSLAMLGRKLSRGDGKELSQKQQIAKDKKAEFKREVIAAYGGKCECCGETEPSFLCIDHPNGGGMEDRAKCGGSVNLYRMLKKLGWPKDNYRLLCMNCNMATKYGRTCPHQLKPKMMEVS